MKRAVATFLLLLVPLSAAATAAPAKRTARRARPPIQLVWHVEDAQGHEVESRLADEPVNPASVVKIATTLWALERLGPEFRYETRCFARGSFDRERGVVQGDLVIQGSGDPDFHVENAFLLAEALNAVGVREVSGALVVNRWFWMGWENGSAGTEPDPVKRGLLMAGRLKQVLDSRRWSSATRRSWWEFAARNGRNGSTPPRVLVRGGIGVDGDTTRGELLVVHRSKPLVDALRRFDCFSNNDIERVAAGLGPLDELRGILAVRCNVPVEAIQLETASGLGTNRLSPRLIVRLLHEFRRTCERVGLTPEAVLPVGGCDGGTITRFFPLLSSGEFATCVVGKTGTLTSTDGGVAVLAGFVATAQGELAFCVAAPQAAGRLKSARGAQERWLLELIARHGGPAPRPCLPDVAPPDVGATVILVATPSP